MKFFFAIKTLTASGGAERVFSIITGELVRRGHDVVIVTFDQPGTSSFYSLDSSIRRIELGIGDVTRNAGIIETLCRMRALRAVAKSEAPLIAIGFMHSMFILLALSLLGLGTSVIGSEHIVPEHYRSRPLQFLLFLLASPFLDKITVLSEAILVSYPRLIRRRMVVMPNPIIYPYGKAKPSAKKSRYILLSVGRLDAQKDQAILIHAFSYLADKWPEWNLKIIGEGPLRAELSSKIKEFGLLERVFLPGVTSDIDAEYLGADVFVIPSRYEAFGLVTAEAMSYGLPVVGFADCPGTNELINDSVCGILVVPAKNRAESLALALERLFANPTLRLQMGSAGAVTVERMVSISNIGDRWENLLTNKGT